MRPVEFLFFLEMTSQNISRICPRLKGRTTNAEGFFACPQSGFAHSQQRKFQRFKPFDRSIVLAANSQTASIFGGTAARQRTLSRKRARPQAQKLSNSVEPPCKKANLTTLLIFSFIAIANYPKLMNVQLLWIQIFYPIWS